MAGSWEVVSDLAALLEVGETRRCPATQVQGQVYFTLGSLGTE